MHSSRRNNSSSAAATTAAAHPYAKEEVDSGVEEDDNDKNSKVRRQTHERFGRRMCLIGMGIGLLGMVLLLVQQQQQQATVHLRLQQQADINRMTRAYDILVDEVRAIKKTGVQMETDPHSLAVTGRLQDAARALCTLKYGNHARIAVTIAYPNAVAPSTFFIEMAPLAFQPYSVYNFLEVARGLHPHNPHTRPQSGFHRKASHVLQATMASDYGQQPLAFQEYSKEYPHKQRTVGYCGRPSGGRGCWYISTLDNTKNHGPGSQQQKNPYEADANFGTVIEGYDVVVPKIRQAMPKEGFLSNPAEWVVITDMTILIPTADTNEEGDTVYVVWNDPGGGDTTS